MPDTALVNLLANVGAVGVFVVLFILGVIYPRSVVTDLKEENAEYKKALAAERERADTAVAAAQASRDMMTALQAGIQLAQRPPEEPARRGGAGS